MTLDQLCYVLERKYENIKIGSDVFVIGTSERIPNTNEIKEIPDAKIVNWCVLDIEQPSQEYLEQLWIGLNEQYNSDPTRIDSDMHKRMYPSINKSSINVVDLSI